MAISEQGNNPNQLPIAKDSQSAYEACRDHMQQNGLPLSDMLIVDGAIHRYSADGK